MSQPPPAARRLDRVPSENQGDVAALVMSRRPETRSSMVLLGASDWLAASLAQHAQSASCDSLESLWTGSARLLGEGERVYIVVDAGVLGWEGLSQPSLASAMRAAALAHDLAVIHLAPIRWHSPWSGDHNPPSTRRAALDDEVVAFTGEVVALSDAAAMRRVVEAMLHLEDQADSFAQMTVDYAKDGGSPDEVRHRHGAGSRLRGALRSLRGLASTQARQ